MHVIVVFFATGGLVDIGTFAVGVGEGELPKVGEDVGEGVEDCIGVGVGVGVGEGELPKVGEDVGEGVEDCIGVGVGVGATTSTRFVNLMAPI